MQASAQNYKSDQVYLKYKDDWNITYPESILDAGLVPDYLVTAFRITKADRSFPRLNYAPLNRSYRIIFEDTANIRTLMRLLRQLPGIDYVEHVPEYRSFLTPNDPSFNSTTQWGLYKIMAREAWDITTGNSNVIVAVVDDAVKINHQDLSANLYVNTNEIPNNGIDDDNNGYIDDRNGYDVADNDMNVNPPSSVTNSFFSHGTHCAGIVAATTNNNIGIASIGYNIKYLPVKTKKNSTTSNIFDAAMQGVEYALTTQAKIISMSWGGGGYSALEQNVFDYANSMGVLLFAAAGNNDNQIAHYPSNYNHVFSVGSTTNQDIKSSFSNYGSAIDLMAPGSGIYSCLGSSSTSYGSYDGTSMACPLVAGTAGLMLSQNPLLTPAMVYGCLKDSSDNISSLNPNYTGLLGAGRLNAQRALRCATGSVLSNDNCSGAIAISPGTTCNYQTFSSSNATQSIPATSPCNGYTGGNSDDDVWFKFSAVSGTTYTIKVLNGSNFDGVLDLRSGSCNGVSIDCDDQPGSSNVLNEIQFTASSNQIYYIRVYHYGLGGGNFQICIVSSTVSSPSPCSNITNISGCGISNSITYTGGGSGNWFNTSNNPCGFNSPGIEQIYSFTAPVTGYYNIEVTSASGFVHFMWKSGSCSTGTWNCIADISSPGTYGAMSWTAGTTYYILLDDENTVSGTHIFYIDCPVGSGSNPCSSIININACGQINSLNYSGSGTGTWFTSWNNPCGNYSSGSEQIYSFTAPVTGVYSIQVSYAVDYVDYFWASGSCSPAGWNCIDRMNFPGIRGPLSWTAGVTYYILLDAESNSSVNHTFHIICPVSCSPPPQPGLISGITSVCAGSNETYSVSPVPGATSYTWTFNNSPIGTNTNSVLFSSVLGNGNLSVVAVNSCGNSISQTVNINILPLPVLNVTPYNSVICSGGGGVNLTATGNAQQYIWSPSTGLNSTSGTMVQANPANNTTYTVVASDGNCSVSDSVFVTVTSVTTASIAASGTVLCSNGSLTLSATQGSGYTWSGPGGFSSSTQNVTASLPGIYSVVVSNPGGCSGTASASVQIVQSSLVVNSGSDQIIQPGNSVVIGGNPTAINGNPPYSYFWSPSTYLNNPGISNPIATPVTTITYTLQVSDADGCSITDDVEIQVISNCYYLLDSQEITIPGTSGTYFVSLNTFVNCSWVVNESCPWIFFASNSGSGPSTLSFLANSNTLGVSRICSLYIENTLLVIIQEPLATHVMGLSSDNLSLRIFPNPNPGVFKIQGDLHNAESLIISIYSAQGQKLYDEILFVEGNRINSEINMNLPVGVYFLQTQCNGIIEYHKLVIE